MFRSAAWIVVALACCIPSLAEEFDKPNAKSVGHPVPEVQVLRRLPPTRRFEGVQVSAAVQPRLPEAIPSGREAASGEGTSLDEFSQAAMANSPTVREAENRAASARWLAVQASLYPNPTVGTASPQLAGNQTQYNAYMSQDLVTKGKIRLDTAAANRAATEAELALVRARFDVLTMVRQRFYSALTAQQRVEVLGGMVKIAKESVNVSEQLLKAGVGSKGDVLLLSIPLSRMEADLQNAVTLYSTSRRQLAAATGVIDLPIDRLRGDLKESLPDYELIAVQRGVLSRNALARSAEVEIGRSQIVLRRAEVEPFPNLNFMGGYQNQGPGANAPTNQAIYQVQMVIPLFNRNQGNIRSAQANVGTAVAQLNRVRTELANATAAALGRYLAAQQQVDRYENEILPNAAEVLKITYQLYSQGQLEFLRYLAAQTTLLDANLQYLNFQEARWTAAAEVANLLQSESFP